MLFRMGELKITIDEKTLTRLADAGASGEAKAIPHAELMRKLGIAD